MDNLHLVIKELQDILLEGYGKRGNQQMVELLQTIEAKEIEQLIAIYLRMMNKL